MLTETLADAEVDIKSLKKIVERKDDELSQSEEQCRHLVRLSEQRHQQILYITTGMNTLEKKAKDIIAKQVSKKNNNFGGKSLLESWVTTFLSD